MNSKIETLRTISILGVLTYHLELPIASGFLGVDVFLVISGFLVYKQIVERRINGDFRLIEFIVRRFFRVYPSLIIILLIVSIASIFLYSPLGEIQTISKSILLSLVPLANYYFITNVGNYFDTYSSSLPTLHLWSLSIELQVWLMMGLLATAISRAKLKNQNAIFFGLSTCGIIILFTAELILFKNYPQSTIYFYSTSLRGLEIICGAFTFLVSRKIRKGFSSSGRFLVLAVILLIFCLPNENAAFLRFLVVILTSLLLLGNESDHQGKAWNLIAGYGKYAYAIYISHWPLIVVLKKYDVSRLGIIIITLVALIIMVPKLYRIERLFTQNVRVPNNTGTFTSGLCGLSVLLILTVGQGVAAQGGGFDPRVQEMFSAKKRSTEACHNANTAKVFKSCTYIVDKSTIKKRIFLIGDSHAASYTEAVMKYATLQNYDYFISTTSGCPALPLQLRRETFEVDCSKYYKYLEMQMYEWAPTHIIVTGRVNNYLNARPRVAEEDKSTEKNCISLRERYACDGETRVTEIFLQALNEFHTNLNPNIQVLIILGQPEFNIEFEKCSTLFNLNNKCFNIASAQHDARNKKSNEVFRSIETNNVSILHIDHLFCDELLCSSIQDEINLFYDSHHLNLQGADFVYKSVVLPELFRLENYKYGKFKLSR